MNRNILHNLRSLKANYSFSSVFQCWFFFLYWLAFYQNTKLCNGLSIWISVSMGMVIITQLEEILCDRHWCLKGDILVSSKASLSRKLLCVLFSVCVLICFSVVYVFDFLNMFSLKWKPIIFLPQTSPKYPTYPSHATSQVAGAFFFDSY